MYNVAPYVERCIRSLEDQDIPKEEYELICVNDGSPDNCREIVEGLQKEFPNIILINQENQGVSRARNNGIETASGKYLLFIDPDDYVEARVLNEKINHLTDNDLDVGITGYTILSEDFKIEYKYDPLVNTNEVLSGIDYADRYMTGRTEIRDPHRSWSIFFKTTFIKDNDLYYLPDVPYLEDGELIYRILCLAKRVSYIAKPFYLRTTRPGSATHSRLFVSDKAIKGFIKAAKNLKEFQSNPSLTSEQITFINQPIIKFSLSPIISCTGIRSIHKIFRVHKQLITHNLTKLDVSGSSRLHKKYGEYYNKSIYYFFLMYLIMKVKISFQNRFRSRKHSI